MRASTAKPSPDPETKAASTSALARVRRLSLRYPETSERLSHGMPSFFVQGKKTFVMFADNHHGDGRLAIWIAAPPGAQEALVGADSSRFFRPPYVGVRGWLGARLDRAPQWAQIAALIDDAYRAIAPARLLQALDSAPPAARSRRRT